LQARLEQAQAAVTAARAARDQARIEYERLKGLVEQSAAAPIEFERVRTALKSAEAGLDQADQARREAETILGYATIASSLDGIVVDKRVEVGDMVTPGQVLLTLYDPTRMQLVASVRESLTQRLEVDQVIGVRVDALDKTCEGRVSEIVPEAETASRSFQVKVTGPCPPGIYSGMFGRLLIPLDDEQVLVIPRSAVRRVGQLHVVDVADGDLLRRRVVQLGRALGDDVEVLAGVRAGERITLNVGPGGRDAGD
jgi:RND family efflux transporter MFP subunit